MADDFSSLINWLRRLVSNGTTAEETLQGVARGIAEIDRNERARRNLPAFSSAPALRGEEEKRTQLLEQGTEAQRDKFYAEQQKRNAADRAALEKKRVDAVDYFKTLREGLKDQSLADKREAEYRRNAELQKGTGEEVDAATQAREIAEIRRKANPRGAALDNRFQERLVQLEQEGVRLDAETKNYEKYGKAINDSRLASLNLEIEQGKLKGISAERIAQLRALAAADDSKAKLLSETETRVNATKASEKFVAKLESEANAHATTARETALANEFAELEAKGLDKRSVAYAQFIGRIYAANEARFDQIATNKLVAEQVASDAEVRKLDEETAALGRSEVVRRKVLAVEKLRAQAAQDIKDDPTQRAAIEAALTKKIDEQTAAIQRNYDATRSASVGIDAAFQKYQDNASNAAAFSENIIGGSLTKLEDGIVKFAETGKFHFGDLFRFMAEEFIRQLARMQVAQATSGLGGYLKLALGAFGGGGTAQGTGPNSGGDYQNGSDLGITFGKQAGVDSASAIGNRSPNEGVGASAKTITPIIHVHDYVGVQTETNQDSAGEIHVLLKQTEDRAAKRGADAGYARVVDDHARGTGRSSQALKSRGVGIGAGSRRA